MMDVLSPATLALLRRPEVREAIMRVTLDNPVTVTCADGLVVTLREVRT